MYRASPNSCLTEGVDETGRTRRMINFDLLKQELSADVVDGPAERYHLNWPGKRAALREANRPIDKTLRPVRGESVDFDTTRNLFIEGDNLDALKLLQETYLGKVKMIYIDPPYNTGKDFIYRDNFTGPKGEHLEASGQVDEEGGRLVANPESNGRYHSDWLSMMYPRLKLARNLLRDDGVIFISIGSEEQSSLKKVCDEIFGEENFCCSISRSTGTRMGSGSSTIANELDYLLLYSKSSQVEFLGLPMSSEELKIYDLEDERGRYLLRSLRRTGGENRREDRPSMYYAVQAPDGTEVFPIAPAGYESRWVCSKQTYKKLVDDGMIDWKFVEREGVSRWQVYQRHYVGTAFKQPSDLWVEGDGNKKATKEVNALFGGLKVFDHPKPTDLVRRMITLSAPAPDDQIVLDFFGGSGTTAHAVMLKNAESEGNRRWIVVQIPEVLNSEVRSQQVARAFCLENNLATTVSEVSKERIRRAGAEIIEKNPKLKGSLDVGFRVLKIESSNMSDVRQIAANTTQDDLLSLVENIKADRTAEDLLFQVLLNWGVDLSLPIARETFIGKGVYFVADDALAACFDRGVDEALVKEIAARKPLRAVFRDDAFKDDSTRINVEQLFKQLSPATELRVI